VKKIFTNVLLLRYGILFIFILGVCLYTWFYMSYTRPIDIHYEYNGIKYQSGNLQSAEPIRIEINGKLTKELYREYGEFDGTIKVGENIFTGRTMVFNKDKMASLESSEGFYGMIFVDNNFRKLTIEIFEPTGNGSYTWDDRTGWMISAPCNDRVEAVRISNILAHQLRNIK